MLYSIVFITIHSWLKWGNKVTLFTDKDCFLLFVQGHMLLLYGRLSVWSLGLSQYTVANSVSLKNLAMVWSFCWMQQKIKKKNKITIAQCQEELCVKYICMRRDDIMWYISKFTKFTVSAMYFTIHSLLKWSDKIFNSVVAHTWFMLELLQNIHLPDFLFLEMMWRGTNEYLEAYNCILNRGEARLR